MLDDPGAVDNELNCGVFCLRWGKGEKCDGYANSGQDPESSTQLGLRGQTPSGTPISTHAYKTDWIVRERSDRDKMEHLSLTWVWVAIRQLYQDQ